MTSSVTTSANTIAWVFPNGAKADTNVKCFAGLETINFAGLSSAVPVTYLRSLYRSISVSLARSVAVSFFIVSFSGLYVCLLDLHRLLSAPARPCSASSLGRSPAHLALFGSYETLLHASIDMDVSQIIQLNPPAALPLRIYAPLYNDTAARRRYLFLLICVSLVVASRPSSEKAS